MFTTKELKSIDRTYFHIISASGYCVTLQSKNTDHYWHIIHQQYPSFVSCKIQHKHRQDVPFHEQGNAALHSHSFRKKGFLHWTELP